MTNKQDHTNSSSGRGGYRENAGRKSSWKHKDTCTIRIPKTFAQQLVELAHRLDNGEPIDTDTESIFRDYDTVTESICVLEHTVTGLAHRRDNGQSIDTDTESNPASYDIVTKSILADDSVPPLAYEQPLDASFDSVTKSTFEGYDSVIKSNTGADDSIPQLAAQQPLDEQIDSVTESIARSIDNVTESFPVPDDQNLTKLIPDLSQAMSQAKAILKSKKSARESLARLLSTLYSAQISRDDLK